jgi:MFS family permease
MVFTYLPDPRELGNIAPANQQGGLDVSSISATAGEARGSNLFTVIAASSMGTAFEWYDFFVFGTLTAIISKQFFAGVGETAGFIFALLTFAAGFAVRPLGALVFGHVGDRTGRKRAFLVTVTMMGVATCAIGLLPTYAQAGVLAPILLIGLRLVQGFALGGEYGGAAIYVAEHAPAHRRGLQTGAIQTSASVGLFGALGVIFVTRSLMGEAAFFDWGWRIPFLVSVGLLGISVWFRLRLEESPLYRRIKEDGRASKAPLRESFLHWPNLKTVLLALFAIMMAQGVVWYTAHFYAQFFLERILKIPSPSINMLMMAVTAVSALLYVFFAWISDIIGRKPVMLFGIGLAVLSFFPVFHMMTEAANPALAAAQASAPVTLHADPAECAVQFDPVGRTVYASSCDIAKSVLSNAGVNYRNVAEPAGATAFVLVGETRVDSADARNLPGEAQTALRKEIEARLGAAITAAGYPAAADPAEVNTTKIFFLLLILVTAATALYGPQAAALVELFPTHIRYTALSLPYNIGTGWFGGFQPAASFSIVAATGDIYSGLWYPVIIGGVSFFLMLFLLPETRGRNIEE